MPSRRKHRPQESKLLEWMSLLLLTTIRYQDGNCRRPKYIDLVSCLGHGVPSIVVKRYHDQDNLLNKVFNLKVFLKFQRVSSWLVLQGMEQQIGRRLICDLEF